MRVTVTPPIRSEFELANRGKIYLERLTELFGSEADILASHNDYTTHPSPFHKFDIYSTIARQEATKGMTPTERATLTFIHRYE